MRRSCRRDAQALVDFHEQLSSRTVYLRFFSAHSHLTEEEIRRFTEGEGRNWLTLVAEQDCRLLAVGRYDRLDGSQVAEVGLVVADAWQHRGIGTFMFRTLAEHARSNGIRELVAKVLPPNRTAIEALTGSKRAAIRWLENGTLEVRIDITEKPAATRAARFDRDVERRQ